MGKKKKIEHLTKITKDSWDELQGSLADSPVSKKYSVLEVIEIAKKRGTQRLIKKIAGSLKPSTSLSLVGLDDAIRMGKEKYFQKKYQKLQKHF